MYTFLIICVTTYVIVAIVLFFNFLVFRQVGREVKDIFEIVFWPIFFIWYLLINPLIEKLRIRTIIMLIRYWVKRYKLKACESVIQLRYSHYSKKNDWLSRWHVYTAKRLAEYNKFTLKENTSK